MIRFVFGDNVIVGIYKPSTGVVIVNPTNDLADVLNTEITNEAMFLPLAIIGWYAAAERVLTRWGAKVDTSDVPALDPAVTY